MKKELRFSANWNNKLDCHCFTTIRLSDRFIVGEELQILLKERFKSFGKVIGKKEYRLSNLDSYTCYLDTGYSMEETVKLLKSFYPKVSEWENTAVYVYLIERRSKTQAEFEFK